MPASETAIAALLDKQAIGEVLVRYCRAIDRCDADLLRSVYWPDGTDDHGIFSGNAYRFVDFIIPYLRRMRATGHCGGNATIRLAGTRAAVESYITAHHLREGLGGPEYYVVGGRYLDVFERRGDEWRLLDRRFVEDWNQIQASNPRAADNPGDRRNYGERWPEDLSYQPAFAGVV